MTSSKYSETLEKSLCVRDKADDLCWMLVVFRPSDIGITKWAQEYFQKPLSVNTIHLNPEMANPAICRCHLKLYHAKRKPYGNMVQKRRRVLWAKAHLKWTVSKWKSVLWSDESKLGPNSNTKTPETHNLHAQTSSNCFEKKRRCYTMLNMPPSQLFWDL